MNITISGISDIGKRRSNNEDTLGIRSKLSTKETPNEIITDTSQKTLAFVCDGMGGMEGGEIASAIAKDSLENWFDNCENPTDTEALTEALETANQSILNEAELRPTYKGMGCTCSALSLEDKRSKIIHIGDSRIYLWRAGKLTQITSDQTVLERLRKEGNLPKNPNIRARFSHTLEQVLGSPPELLKPEIIEGNLQNGDLFIICSDGLYEGLEHIDIYKIVNRYLGRVSTKGLTNILVQTSLERSGGDNITAVLVQIGDPTRQPYIKFVFQCIFNKIGQILSTIKDRIVILFTRN